MALFCWLYHKFEVPVTSVYYWDTCNLSCVPPKNWPWDSDKTSSHWIDRLSCYTQKVVHLLIPIQASSENSRTRDFGHMVFSEAVEQASQSCRETSSSWASHTEELWRDWSTYSWSGHPQLLITTILFVYSLYIWPRPTCTGELHKQHKLLNYSMVLTKASDRL